jgi:signal transduction histidine kinase
MPTLEVFKARAFRIALAFSLAIAAAMVAAFGFIYWSVYTSDIERVGSILVDEAARAENDSEADLRRALQRRLTRDIRRLDYVAVFDSHGAMVFGDVPGMPEIPVDGRAHVVQEQLLPNSSGDREPAIFVARRLANGGVLLLGRSLWETYDLQRTLRRALGIALLPTLLVILGIGALFARRASTRLEGVHGSIVRFMNGELEARLPVTDEGDDIDKVARTVNLMLDEVVRLLDQLKSVGDNIAHDLRTPLAVARARIERALDNEGEAEQLRGALEVALAQIEKASATISAILRISAVENSVREQQFKDFDLAAVCAQLVDFYEPLAESKGVTMIVEAETPVPVRGDQDLMREALSNLIDNAIKFTPQGGVVRIDARTVDDRPSVCVSDTGVGVPPQERTRIFERFYRGERSGAAAGHGLGLSIAATVAKLHGFQLTVEDNRPGARFELRAAGPGQAGVTRGLT